jgi:hypothetical protein
LRKINNILKLENIKQVSLPLHLRHWAISIFKFSITVLMKLGVLPGHECVGLAGQSSDRAEIDDVSGHLGHQHLLDVGANLQTEKIKASLID